MLYQSVRYFLLRFKQGVIVNKEGGIILKAQLDTSQTARKEIKISTYSGVLIVAVFSVKNEFNLRTALFWAITQHVVVITFRRFGTTYRSHLQRSRIQQESNRSESETESQRQHQQTD